MSWNTKMKDHPELRVQEVRDAVQSLQHDLLLFLDEIVACNSHSYNTDGVAQVAKMVVQALPRAFESQDLPTLTDGTLWAFRHRLHGSRPILLVGHLDTVFPPGSFERGLISDGPYLLGPGVADMKGGIAVVLGALWALDRLGILSETPLALAFNGDEEIGSPASSSALVSLAQNSRCVLVFECGGPGGAVVTSRRGLKRYHLEITGAGGHAGTLSGAKTSAVVELAHQILHLEALNENNADLTVNVGRVQSGIAANVVPERGEAEFEVRFWGGAGAQKVKERIHNQISAPRQSGLQLRLTQTHERPVMPRTPATAQLYEAAVRTAARLDWALTEEARRGASDANQTAAAGLPTLDGLGPVGEMDHSVHERILKDSLLERVELLVHLLWDLRGWSHEPVSKQKKLPRSKESTPRGRGFRGRAGFISSPGCLMNDCGETM